MSLPRKLKNVRVIKFNQSTMIAKASTSACKVGAIIPGLTRANLSAVWCQLKSGACLQPTGLTVKECRTTEGLSLLTHLTMMSTPQGRLLGTVTGRRFHEKPHASHKKYMAKFCQQRVPTSRAGKRDRAKMQPFLETNLLSYHHQGNSELKLELQIYSFSPSMALIPVSFWIAMNCRFREAAALSQAAMITPRMAAR